MKYIVELLERRKIYLEVDDADTPQDALDKAKADPTLYNEITHEFHSFQPGASKVMDKDEKILLEE